MTTRIAFKKTTIAALMGITSSVYSIHSTANANDFAFEEVLVTAQKKGSAERLQEVPIAISAFSGKQIDALFAETINDIGKTAPNVGLQEVGTYPGIANFSVRGMGLASSLASDEPTVGTIVDGMYLGVNFGVTLDTFDLEAVEILRGPQGTLFGRNVTGGAVVIRTRKPADEFGFRAKVTAGSDSRQDVAISVEGGLSDSLAAKLVVSNNDREGTYNNINTAARDDKIGDRKSTVVRPKLLWTPFDSVEVILTAEHGEVTGDGASTRNLDKPGTLTNNPFLPFLAYTSPKDERDLDHNFEGETDLEWNQLINEVNWDVGGGTVTSITGWRDIDVTSSTDADGTPFTLAHITVGVEQDQFSQELRFASTAFNEFIDYTAGVYYFNQDVEATETRDLTVVNLVVPTVPAIIAGLGISDHWSAAAFTQVEFNFSDALTGTLGLRYGVEEKDAQIAPFGFCAPFSKNCVIALNDSERWENLSPKLGLSFRVSDDILVYTSLTRGFRSGGFSFRQANAYDDEVVDAFEAGFKSDLLDKRLRINGAVFYNKFDDVQRTVLHPITAAQNVLNAAKMTISGAEIDLLASLTDELVITASAGYLDASYDEFNGLDLTGDGIPDPELAKGLKVERAPRWTTSLGVLYDTNLGDLGDLSWRASYSFTDERPVNTNNSAVHEPYELYDASVTWTGQSEHFSVSLFGKNLGDEVYADTGADTFIGRQDYLQPGRTWGLEVSYEY